MQPLDISSAHFTLKERDILKNGVCKNTIEIVLFFRPISTRGIITIIMEHLRNSARVRLTSDLGEVCESPVLR